MGSKIRFIFLLPVLLLAYSVQLLAQDTLPESPFHPGATGAEIFTWYTALYGAVVTALTYVQGWLFPKAGSIPKTAVRYVLIAAVTAGIFITLGFSNGLGAFVGFIGSALVYDKVLSPLGLKTPTPIARDAAQKSN